MPKGCGQHKKASMGHYIDLRQARMLLLQVVTTPATLFYTNIERCNKNFDELGPGFWVW